MRNLPKLLIKLTPLEPYFFGGQRIYEIGDENRHYFIRSLDAPSQTTLFGALRYMGIKNPDKGFWLDEEDKKNVGEYSYDLTDEKKWEFGRIHSISPLFLLDNDKERNGFLIRTPLDHIKGSKKVMEKEAETKEAKGKEAGGEAETKEANGGKAEGGANTKEANGGKAEGGANTKEITETYTRFEEYSDPVHTTAGIRHFPKEYDAKAGLSYSWMSLGDERIYADLFEGIQKLGIDTNNKRNGYFKREYKRLREGFSFAFFADVDQGFSLHNHIVYLGQGKSAFRVDWDWNAHEPTMPWFLRKEMVYAQSDWYISGNVEELYKMCKFVCVDIRDFRVFTTNYAMKSVKNRFKKDNHTRLIQAGSVFWPNNLEEFTEKIRNSHGEIAGFNHFITGGGAK